jgi:hypothetical protein
MKFHKAHSYTLNFCREWKLDVWGLYLFLYILTHWMFAGSGGSVFISIYTCTLNVCREWKLGDWGLCSSSCDIGDQLQSVTCVSTDPSGRSVPVADDRCEQVHGQKPEYRRSCNENVPCPFWTTLEWSSVSDSVRGSDCSLYLLHHFNFFLSFVHSPCSFAIFSYSSGFIL